MTIAVVCKNQATFRRYRKAHPTDTCVHVWEDYGVVAGVEIDSIVILQAHSDMHYLINRILVPRLPRQYRYIPRYELERPEVAEGGATLVTYATLQAAVDTDVTQATVPQGYVTYNGDDQ